MSGRGPVMRVPTRAGTITIAPALAVAVCSACPQRATLELTVDVNHRDEDLELPLCGDCLAEALAIHIGRRHVQAGGRITDLSRTPPDDPLDLESLGPIR